MSHRVSMKVSSRLRLAETFCVYINIRSEYRPVDRNNEVRNRRNKNMDRNAEGTELTQINRRRSTSVQPERTRPPPLRTMSEASVYRANSRQRISIKSGIYQNNKTLDRLMNCFWTCSPGCHEA
ncbi:hypothetical protein GE061_000982 [Apolygus lucorum]|uniref:Uncharacterized protein n=1 Tax=Apolygus lucorum TaxID=248454 RepID=A0A6A4KLK0_APOLU|nr:hypothetical protein GE061_000982 [Apolygus lucorum]